MSKPKITAKSIPTKVSQCDRLLRPYMQHPDLHGHADPWKESLRWQVAQILGVARLLDNIAENRYDNQGAWEEFGVQVDTLATALVDRLMGLEEWLNRSQKPAKAA